jgi:hypothetical protein
MRIRNYRSDYHEFREFWWKFHDLWMKGSIKINWRENIRSIQRLRFDQGALWVQLGVENLAGCKLGMASTKGLNLALKKNYKRAYCWVFPVHHHLVSLNMTSGPSSRAPSPSECITFPLIFISLSLGPTWTEIRPPPLTLFFFSAYSIFFNKNKWKMVKGSNSNGKLQLIYRWKALTEENPLK